jgi:hypothetical protein
LVVFIELSASARVLKEPTTVDCAIGFSATTEQCFVVASCTTQYSSGAIASAGTMRAEEMIPTANALCITINLETLRMRGSGHFAISLFHRKPDICQCAQRPRDCGSGCSRESGNFPMAIDPSNGRVLIVSRNPPRFKVYAEEDVL